VHYALRVATASPSQSQGDTPTASNLADKTVAAPRAYSVEAQSPSDEVASTSAQAEFHEERQWCHASLLPTPVSNDELGYNVNRFDISSR
jgi:hypothetical protein